MEKIKLTQFSNGAGCGCKISPATLEEILKTNVAQPHFTKLLVGNSSNDDAAVFDLGSENALVSTTDFFTPIVDDPYDFGRIAAANAISDVYAMGGRPAMAIAILGWPVDKLPVSAAQEVIEGARAICIESGIPLAGGHSINIQEPIFGLAVSGFVNPKNLKKNNTARENDLLFITKPIGVGILSTAEKRGKLSPEHHHFMIKQMVSLNSIGEILGTLEGVHAMTDITGFGLAGHLMEMARGSNLSATINYAQIPVIPFVQEYLSQNIIPDATYRNWNSYGDNIFFNEGVNMLEAFNLLPDPQTNGGLLIAVAPDSAERLIDVFNENNLSSFITPIGRLSSKQEKLITIIP